VEEQKDFGELEKDLAHFTRAIGHPARVAVLLAIARKGTVSRGELLSVPPLAPATVTQHLRDLKRAGLITGRIFGSNSNFELDHDNLKKFNDDFQSFVKLIYNNGQPAEGSVS